MSASASVSTSSTSADTSGSTSGKSDKATTGWILVGVGGVVGITGLVIDVVGANSGTIQGANGTNTDNSRTDLYFLGTTLLIAGIVTCIYGGSMVWSANKGQDTTTSAPAEKDEAKADSVSKAAQARLQAAPSFVVPVIGATF